MNTSLIFAVITAAGTVCTILVIIWNNGRNRGEIKMQIIALQKDVIRQNGIDANITKKVDGMVEKGDCIRLHNDLQSQRQQSEERIIAAISKKRRPMPSRARTGK